MTGRFAELARKTRETEIELKLDIDGAGEAKVNTGIGFFDHMLTLLAKHALFDVEVTARGDLEVDQHHTVEDVGITLGQALVKAAGDKRGIRRYGFMLLPMDEALARVALDFSGRACLEWRVEVPREKAGDFDTCLAREFMRAFCNNAGINMHVDLLAGLDPHHVIEAIFKGLGQALRQSLSFDAREKGIPSSKGVL